jgi:hypothetical protein
MGGFNLGMLGGGGSVAPIMRRFGLGAPALDGGPTAMPPQFGGGATPPQMMPPQAMPPTFGGTPPSAQPPLAGGGNGWGAQPPQFTPHPFPVAQPPQWGGGGWGGGGWGGQQMPPQFGGGRPNMMPLRSLMGYSAQ